jgi:hypothetical protein
MPTLCEHTLGAVRDIQKNAISTDEELEWLIQPLFEIRDQPEDWPVWTNGEAGLPAAPAVLQVEYHPEEEGGGGEAAS